MKQFKKWKEKRAIKTMGWLNNSSAYIAGEEAGWRAALKMVLKKEDEVKFVWRAEYKSEEAIPTIYDEIREELQDE